MKVVFPEIRFLALLAIIVVPNEVVFAKSKPKATPIETAVPFNSEDLPKAICRLYRNDKNLGAMSRTFLCTGTLIAKNKILTAAHCFVGDKKNSEYFWSCGDSKKPNSIEDKRVFQPSAISVAPKFSQLDSNARVAYDAAIVTLPFPERSIEPIEIANFDREKELINQYKSGNCVLAGAGLAKNEDINAYEDGTTKAGMAKSLRDEEIKKFQNAATGRDDLRLLISDQQTFALKGDSGGPLLCFDAKQKKWVQIGIHSRSYGKDRPPAIREENAKASSVTLHTPTSSIYDFVYPKFLDENSKHK